MKITNAYIEITNVCNLNCRYCYNSSGTVHARKELSLAQLKHIVSRLTDEFGCAGISLSGGDPTLHSEFEEILAYLLGFPQLDISVVTNGTTGNQALTDAYNAYPNLRIQVSLDGSCEAVNARTRGSGHFSDIAAFLSKLRHPDKSPVIKMVVSSANMTDVEAYYKFAMDNGCVPAFDFVNKSGNAVGDWDDLDISAKQKLSVLSAVERLNHEYGRDVALPYCTSKCPLTLPDAELSVLVKCATGYIFPSA